MYLLREDARLSYPHIGTLLGGRDHSSVLHACEKMTAEMNRDAPSRRDARAVRDLLQ
jgi:chromosomal replication initiator protein